MVEPYGIIPFWWRMLPQFDGGKTPSCTVWDDDDVGIRSACRTIPVRNGTTGPTWNGEMRGRSTRGPSPTSRSIGTTTKTTPAAPATYTKKTILFVFRPRFAPCYLFPNKCKRRTLSLPFCRKRFSLLCPSDRHPYCLQGRVWILPIERI